MFKGTGIISRPIWLVFCLVTAIFLADLYIEHSHNISFWYLLAMIPALFFRERNDVILLGIIITALTFFTIFLKPQDVDTNEVLMDRSAGVLAIWIAASLILKIITQREGEEEQEEQFRALFLFATNSIVVVNGQGEIVQINPAAEKLFGYPAAEMIGEKVEKLIPRRLTHKHEDYRNNYRVAPHPRAMGIGLDLYALHKDGHEIPVEVSLSPFHTKKGEFVMAFVLDNSIRKAHESRIISQKQELENLTTELQQLNEGLEEKIHERTLDLETAKNELAQALDKERELGELKSRFVSMASHEFRTPLSTILSSASLISTYAERDDVENIKKHATRIKKAVNNMNSILTEFLSLGKLEEGKTQPNLQEINLPDCVEDVASELKPLFKSGQMLEFKHAGNETAFLDNALLKHILINLITNAIKYSPEKSTIRIVTEINVQNIRISVSDEGIGIPEQEQKHLFTRFFRASNAVNTQGTGLGLYIVKSYTELMNGEIGFTTSENAGTTFWVEFPATA